LALREAGHASAPRDNSFRNRPAIRKELFAKQA
jgi:hypothetical protein